MTFLGYINCHNLTSSEIFFTVTVCTCSHYDTGLISIPDIWIDVLLVLSLYLGECRDQVAVVCNEQISITLLRYQTCTQMIKLILVVPSSLWKLCLLMRVPKGFTHYIQTAV